MEFERVGLTPNSTKKKLSGRLQSSTRSSLGLLRPKLNWTKISINKFWRVRERWESEGWRKRKREKVSERKESRHRRERMWKRAEKKWVWRNVKVRWMCEWQKRKPHKRNKKKKRNPVTFQNPPTYYNSRTFSSGFPLYFLVFPFHFSWLFPVQIQNGKC